ncbi:MAG: DUF2764 domain-containing protein [Treponema sp.]|jgi:hypothetical protein|nr:DUF2764 domain-containing protein [Treponema sp.]
MAYYYLAAQLPYLVYGQQSPMSSQAFRALCVHTLSAEDAALLDRCSLDMEHSANQEKGCAEPPAPTSSRFINEWQAWERALRLNLVRYRAQKRNNSASIEPPDSPADAALAAKVAFALESPLEAELFIDQARWNAIEAMQGLDLFSVNMIYAYLLKLLLMERRAAFKVEEGFAEYKGLYDAILASASQGVEK